MWAINMEKGQSCSMENTNYLLITGWKEIPVEKGADSSQF